MYKKIKLSIAFNKILKRENKIPIRQNRLKNFLLKMLGKAND